MELPGGGRLVLLDTSVPGAGYGHLEAEQLHWLSDVLAETAPAGTVLALHHPPLIAATPLQRALDLDGLAELGTVLEGSDVRIVLAGHYHHAMTGSIAGIPVHVGPGVANVVDPLTQGADEQALALSGASVIELGDDGPPQVLSAVHPNLGDSLEEVERPVYSFSPEDVSRIVAAAGR